MDMTGERRIPAPRQTVWNALNDVGVLKACIPGCESLERVDDTDLKATAAVKIGPIAARFAGKVQLLDLDPPSSYRIQGEGQGGVAGFAKGGATVKLAEDGDLTLLTYEVKAQVGGKIAQLGARLIDASARQMADAFFDHFTATVAATLATETGATETGAAGPADLVAAAAGEAPGTATVVPTPAPAPAPQISVLDLIPARPFGFPLVFWIGGAIFVLIFLLIFGTYL